jgi:ABC-type phosphate transport system substrate-binding protein
VKIKKVVALGAALGVALAGVALAAPAHAEPVSNSYVLVGSDTLQDVANALTNGTSISGTTVRVSAGGQSIGSFDAFGSSVIQTKSNGTYFTRPAGSGAGVTALRASITGNPFQPNPNLPARTITNQVDIARSSSGPGSNANSSGLLSYVPFARDAVAYAYNGSNADLANLTTAQLKQIYESATPVTIGSTVVKPRIPQSGSGTRTFFLGAIGVTTLGASVGDSSANVTPENDASVLGANEIIPFSAANWIAQSNGATGLNTIGTSTVKLGSVNGIAPYTGTGTNLSANPAFYSSSFGRDTYLVVEFARVNPSDAKYDVNLANLVNPTRSVSLANNGTFPSTAGSVKLKFGFLAPSNLNPIRAYAAL